MKKLVLLSILIFFFYSGFSQQIVPVSNPLEKILQNEFDSTILFSTYSNWDMKPNYYILSKKDSLVYFYRYCVNHINYSGRNISPYKSEIFPKIMSSDLEIQKTEPDINVFFKWVDTKISKKSIWNDITKYNLWNFVDDDNIKSSESCITTDGGFSEFKLITKNRIIKLKYYDPSGLNECEFNKTRDDIIKIGKIIRSF